MEIKEERPERPQKSETEKKKELLQKSGLPYIYHEYGGSRIEKKLKKHQGACQELLSENG